MFVTKNQIFIFITCIAFGVVGGAILSLFSFVKIKLKNSIVIFVVDLFSFIVITFLYVLFSLRMEFTDFRLYMTIGVFVGIAGYLKSFHIIVAKCLKKIYNIIEKRYRKVKNDRIKSKKTNCCGDGGGGNASRYVNVNMDLPVDSNKRQRKKSCRT